MPPSPAGEAAPLTQGEGSVKQRRYTAKSRRRRKAVPVPPNRRAAAGERGLSPNSPWPAAGQGQFCEDAPQGTRWTGKAAAACTRLRQRLAFSSAAPAQVRLPLHPALRGPAPGRGEQHGRVAVARGETLRVVLVASCGLLQGSQHRHAGNGAAPSSVGQSTAATELSGPRRCTSARGVTLPCPPDMCRPPCPPPPGQTSSLLPPPEHFYLLVGA